MTQAASVIQTPVTAADVLPPGILKCFRGGPKQSAGLDVILQYADKDASGMKKFIHDHGPIQDGLFCLKQSRPCFGFLSSTACYAKGSIAVFAFHYYQPVQGDMQLEFLDWLYNRSPWCNLFIIKDPMSTAYGCRTDAPSDHVLQAMCLARGAYYGTKRDASIFHDMRKRGYDEDISFIASGIMYPRYVMLGTKSQNPDHYQAGLHRDDGGFTFVSPKILQKNLWNERILPDFGFPNLSDEGVYSHICRHWFGVTPDGMKKPKWLNGARWDEIEVDNKLWKAFWDSSKTHNDSFGPYNTVDVEEGIRVIKAVLGRD